MKAFRLLHRGRYDLLHTHEEACFFGLLLAKLFGLPHLYDMHSSLPQQLTNFRWGRLRLLVGLFAWLERWVVQSSDAVITICPDLETHVERTNGNVPHIMIENMASEEKPPVVTDEELISFKAMYEVCDEHKVILYTGNFEPYQGIDLLINAAERVLQQRQNVLFVLVGGTPQQVQRYQHQVQGCGLLPYFRFAGLRPPHDMPYFMQLAHILVSPRVSGTNTPL
jgi:glycosyltransferase involved in cell wall biosynthesis